MSLMCDLLEMSLYLELININIWRECMPQSVSTSIYLRPTGLHSRAMVRVANALESSLPSTFSIAGSPAPQYSDIVVLHVIGSDAIDHCKHLISIGQRYIIIQYCLLTAGYNESTADDWHYIWSKAELVWSYYDLPFVRFPSYPLNRLPFYYAPLGLDEPFTKPINDHVSRHYIFTSGYVSGPGAEAIEEMWLAARHCNLPVMHLGPSKVEGIQDSTISSYPLFRHAIPDTYLADLYSQSLYVSGLRHVEGFELPALEGIACGARPILFDLPCYRKWYRNRAIYVPDCHGQELVDILIDIFNRRPKPVFLPEHAEICRLFNWSAITSGFWASIML